MNNPETDRDKMFENSTGDLIAEARKWNDIIGNPFARGDMTNADVNAAVTAIESALESAEIAALESVTAPAKGERDALTDAVGDALADAMLCHRVWEAWGVGTMTEDDFSQASDDEEFVAQIVDAVIAVRLPVTAPTEATGGAQLISAERTRQIVDEGYSAQEDAGKAHALVDAAVAYAHAGRASKGKAPLSWPWADRFWKPSGDPVRNLTKAGALIAAAIDSIRSAEVSS